MKAIQLTYPIQRLASHAIQQFPKSWQWHPMTQRVVQTFSPEIRRDHFVMIKKTQQEIDASYFGKTLTPKEELDLWTQELLSSERTWDDVKRDARLLGGQLLLLSVAVVSAPVLLPYEAIRSLGQKSKQIQIKDVTSQEIFIEDIYDRSLARIFRFFGSTILVDAYSRKLVFKIKADSRQDFPAQVHVKMSSHESCPFSPARASKSNSYEFNRSWRTLAQDGPYQILFVDEDGFALELKINLSEQAKQQALLQ